MFTHTIMLALAHYVNNCAKYLFFVIKCSLPIYLSIYLFLKFRLNLGNCLVLLAVSQDAGLAYNADRAIFFGIPPIKASYISIYLIVLSFLSIFHSYLSYLTLKLLGVVFLERSISLTQTVYWVILPLGSDGVCHDTRTELSVMASAYGNDIMYLVYYLR